MKFRNITLCAAACALVVPLTGCGAMVTQQDLTSLNNRVQRNEQQIAALGGGQGTGSSAPGQAEMWAQLQSIRQDLNSVQGQLSGVATPGNNGATTELSAQVNRIEAAVRKIGTQLAIPLPMLDAKAAPYAGGASNQPPATSYQTPTTVSVPGAAAPDTAGSTATASSLYDAGTRAFSERRYADAIQTFRQFVQQYPSDKLTSNAYFWQGESSYQLKDYNAAIQAYQQVIEKFPNSGKLQSALFKQGVSLYYNGHKDAAKIRLNELIKNYPQAQEAERAKQFLAQNQ